MRLSSAYRLLCKLSIVLSVSGLASNGYAQQAPDSRPASAAAQMKLPAPPYGFIFRPTSSAWPYSFNVTSSTVPTIDYASSLYLPYLPWMGDNLALLVNYANFFYQQAKGNVSGDAAYNSAVSMAANQALYEIRPKTQENANEATQTGVQGALSSDQSAAMKLKNDLMKIPGTDIMPTCRPTDILCLQQQKNDKPTDDAFNADSLLGTIAYANDDKNKVTIPSLITFLTNGIDPLPPLPPKSDIGNLNVQKFVLQSRALAAGQSVALSNLNYLAQERKIVRDLGKKAGMTTLPTNNNAKVINNASQLQLEQFLISRRVSNESWYTAVNTAPSIAVQREMLFVLAEMSEQLFQLRMLNERMLATLSTMQTQMTQFNKANLTVVQQAILGNKDNQKHNDVDNIPDSAKKYIN